MTKKKKKQTNNDVLYDNLKKQHKIDIFGDEISMAQ